MALRIPITLITGSVGSGKTTLLKRILETVGRRVAVLMNEFGEIAVDSKIIDGENVRIIELTGGCVCCSLAGEFDAAVKEIVEKIAPQLIIVEATGVAEADALVYEVEDNLPEVRLDGVICVVDAYLNIRYPYLGYTTRAQLEAADIVLINKIDLVKDEELLGVETQIGHHNDHAVTFKTVHCNVAPELLFGLDIEQRVVPVPHHHQTEFESFTYISDALLDVEKFLKMASDLPLSVYRAKGFVRFSGGSQLFNYVVGRVDLEDFPADATQLVFIGRHLHEIRDLILSELHHCEV